MSWVWPEPSQVVGNSAGLRPFGLSRAFEGVWVPRLSVRMRGSSEG